MDNELKNGTPLVSTNVPKWQDLTTEQAQKQWEQLQDELNLYYGGDFVNYLLERMGSSNLRKQVAFLECIKLVRDYENGEVEYDYAPMVGLTVWYNDGADSLGVRL